MIIKLWKEIVDFIITAISKLDSYFKINKKDSRTQVLIFDQ